METREKKELIAQIILRWCPSILAGGSALYFGHISKNALRDRDE